jgi:glycine/D-amino acid oxidase-like deaminating enzyme
MHEVDTLIVGGGIAGLSTAWHLAASEGGRILLLERENVLGSMSSGLNAGILRTLGSDALTTTLGRRSTKLFLEPPPCFGDAPLVDPCGLLLVADQGHTEELASWIKAAGLGPDEAPDVGPAGCKRLAPHFGGEVAVAHWFPGEGRLDVAALVEGFARGARQRGVEIRTGAEVTGLLTRRTDSSAGGVSGVRLSSGQEIRAGITILASGGWAGNLGIGAGSRVRLRPTRRHLLTTRVDASVDPSWPVVWSLSDGFYCRPESGGLLLCACDQVEVDPDHCVVDEQILETIAEKAQRLLPDYGDAGIAHYWCGMRTLTRDDRFAIGPDPDLAGLFWVAGLGGHGMVCGPEVGRLAADRLLGASTDPLHPALDPSRLL